MALSPQFFTEVHFFPISSSLRIHSDAHMALCMCVGVLKLHSAIRFQVRGRLLIFELDRQSNVTPPVRAPEATVLFGCDCVKARSETLFSVSHLQTQDCVL